MFWNCEILESDISSPQMIEKKQTNKNKQKLKQHL